MDTEKNNWSLTTGDQMKGENWYENKLLRILQHHAHQNGKSGISFSSNLFLPFTNEK